MRDGVKFDDVMAVVNKNLPPGVKIDEKAAWVKLDAGNGNKMYISKREIVRQIDLAGFGAGAEGTIKPPRKNGRVEAQLDIADPDFFFFLEQAIKAMAHVPEQNVPVRSSSVEQITPMPSRQRRNTAITQPPPDAPMPNAVNPRRRRTTRQPENQ